MGRKKKIEKELVEILKRIVLKRDKFRCQYCGSRKDLQVHHIVSQRIVSTRYDPENLITLCKKCHLKISKSPFERDKFLIYLVMKKGLEKIIRIQKKAMKKKRLTKKEIEFLKIFYKTQEEKNGNN